jgi:hypothetical protein
MEACIPNQNWMAVAISIIALIVSIAGWFFTHWLTTVRERNKRLRGFRSFIELLYSNIKALKNPDDIFTVYKSSISNVESECIKIREDIDSCFLDDFNTASLEFRTVTTNQIYTHDPKNVSDKLFSTGPIKPRIKVPNGQCKMLSTLKKLKKYAKDGSFFHKFFL